MAAGRAHDRAARLPRDHGIHHRQGGCGRPGRRALGEGSDKAIDKDKRCTCDPTYYGTVWDSEIGRNRKTERRPLIGEAKNLRADLLADVRGGNVVERPKGIRLSDAHPEFVEDCRDGIVLNRYGKPYTKNAVTNLDSSLDRPPKRIRDKHLEKITSGLLQSAVDDFRRLLGRARRRGRGRIL